MKKKYQKGDDGKAFLVVLSLLSLIKSSLMSAPFFKGVV
jgi:hypothetical protein